MSNYSDDAASVRVDFFKESGKWYCTEAVKWPEGLYFAKIASGQYNLIHDAFRKALDDHFGNKPRLKGMRAICLEPYHENSHPISIIV
jgi:hypothetical protein